jgi:type I restriction enzyme S subunit
MQTTGCIHDGWLALRNPKADTDFLYFILSSEVVSNQFESLAAGSAVRNLNVEIAKKVKIPLPPLAEQRKIAEILRTWDEAIETAEDELKAKQERKRGLMLTCLAPAIEAQGANRWRTVRLGEICNPQQWTTIGQSQMTATGIPVYGANSFIGFFSESNHDGDVIAVSCRGSCGEVAFVMGPSYVTGNSMCLDEVDDAEVDIYWLYQCLKLRGFRDIISGSAQPQIIRKDMIKVKISLPPLSAQEKTAEVLLSADHDIETINSRIEALCTQKRGLMQKLLTGEVRVAA